MNNKKKKLLLIDDEKNMLHMLSSYLGKRGYEIATALNGNEGVKLVKTFAPDFILCDLKMPKMDGLAFLNATKGDLVDVPIIMMSAYATVDTAVEAMKQGAYDFVTKPFKTDEIICILQKAEEFVCIKKENIELRTKVQELQHNKTFSGIIGNSSVIRKVIEQAKKVAGYDTSVLITGESGTGKELIAKGIHNHSKRKNGPLISVNCGSIPLSLLESEFFGYVKGAFTGADRERIGLFESAEGGTLFLDEIGELPLELQVKLLRVLQEHEIRPVGSSKHKAINVRILAATAKNLNEEIEKGKFRQDLLFRLNVVELELPPLRDRSDDIPLLTHHFIKKYNHKLERNIRKVTKEASACLMDHKWPGNIRELENTIERAVIYAEEDVLLSEYLPSSYNIKETSAKTDMNFENIYSLKAGRKILEFHLINKVLDLTEGNKSQAAQILELSYPSLLKKIKDLNI